VTTPAHDAPLVFPSVAFRPVRLLVISVVITALAMLAGGFSGRLQLGMFFGVGLLLGLLNALLVRRSVESITAGDHPLKRNMAVNSASRLAIITILALILAFVFRPDGLGVVFGLALFQVLLVVTTTLPILQKIRSSEAPVSVLPSSAEQPLDSHGERSPGDA
jgi:ATP synthase I chain